MFGRFDAPDRTRVCRRNSECVPTLRDTGATSWEVRAVLTFGYSPPSPVLAILLLPLPSPGLTSCAATGKLGSPGDVATLPAALTMRTESPVLVPLPGDRAVGSLHPAYAPLTSQAIERVGNGVLVKARRASFRAHATQQRAAVCVNQVFNSPASSSAARENANNFANNP